MSSWEAVDLVFDVQQLGYGRLNACAGRLARGQLALGARSDGRGAIGSSAASKRWWDCWPS